MLLNRLLAKPKKLLATILVANNFLQYCNCNSFLVFIKVFSTITIPTTKIYVEVILVTFLILLFGEVLPKVYASRNNVKFAGFIAYPISILEKIASPLSLPFAFIN
jgi:putative hemolysin